MKSPATLAFRRLGLSPKKSFGQNFLTDRSMAERIAALATTPEGAPSWRLAQGWAR